MDQPSIANSTLQITSTDKALGALISGVDVRHVDDATFNAIHQAWLANLVIVIRGQQLTDDELTHFAARFGVLDEAPPMGKRPARDFVGGSDGHPRGHSINAKVSA